MGKNTQSRNNKDGKSGFNYEAAYSGAENIDVLKEIRKPPKQIRRKKEKQKRLLILAGVAAAVIVAVIAAIIIIAARPKETVAEETGAAVLTTGAYSASINRLYIYGTHLGMEGTLPKEILEYSNVRTDLVLYNGEFIDIPIKTDGEGNFRLSDNINDGLYLDDIPRGEYAILVRVTSKEPFPDDIEAESETTTDAETQTTAQVTGIVRKKPEETLPQDEAGDGFTDDGTGEYYYHYYTLSNNTDYPKTDYYTMSTWDNYLVFEKESVYSTLGLTVSENTNDEVVDFVIDAARGGSDKGAVGIDGKTETKYNLPLALKIKTILEENGMKVALTRSDDKATLKPYGDDGRIARVCRPRAKYMVSLTMNSSGTGGLEIYAATDLDYTFASLLNEKIQTATGISDTATTDFMKAQNVFARAFSQKDVDEVIADNENNQLKPYEPTTSSCYYYMIRESGGIATGAFKDDRNPKESYNPYAKSNTGVESYILELGYINQEQDVKIMETKMDEYANAIAQALLTTRKNLK